MSQTPVAITTGTGAASVAAELVSGTSFQQIEVYGGGGASVLSVNPDGSVNASIIGTLKTTISGSASIVSTIPSSVLVGASIFGQLPAGNAIIGAVAASISGVPNIQGKDAPVSSITGNPIYISGKDANGSVAGMQVIGGAVIASVSGNVGVIGTPSISGTVNVGNTITINSPSVYGNVSGSVVGFQGGAWTTSVVGTVTASIQGAVTITGSVLTLQAPTASLVSGISSVITGTAVTSVLAIAPGGQRNYVSHILVTNQQTSVTGAGTQVNIIDDGSGTVMYAGYAAAGGGGFALSFPTPLRQPTSTFSISAKAISQASILVGMSGYTNS